MVSSIRQASAWLVVAWLATAATSALASPVPYGDYGPDFPSGFAMYMDVVESSGTDPLPPGRYGQPELSGNVLDFDPMQFTAAGSNGLSDNTDIQLNFDLMSLEVNDVVAGGFTTLLVEESGHYSLTGGGTAATNVGAAIGIDIDILEVDGVPVNTPSGRIEVSASTSLLYDLPNNGPVMLQSWSNSLLIDFAPILANENIAYQFGVTKAEIVINDQLIAASELTSQAFIAKKDFRITPDSTPNPGFENVPEPASVVLLTTLLAGAWGYRRLA